MAGDRSQHRLGIALVVAAAVAWSTAPFFTRLLPFDSWTILFWRGLFGGGLIAVLLVLMQGRAGLRDLTGMGANGWLVASLSTAGMVAFIPALQLTSVSNVAIIIATGPFVAAPFAWIWLGEAARWQTMLASLGSRSRRHHQRYACPEMSDENLRKCCGLASIPGDNRENRAGSAAAGQFAALSRERAPGKIPPLITLATRPAVSASFRVGACKGSSANKTSLIFRNC